MNLFGGGSGSSSSPHKEMTTSEFLKEAKEFAKTKGMSSNLYISLTTVAKYRYMVFH